MRSSTSHTGPACCRTRSPRGGTRSAARCTMSTSARCAICRYSDDERAHPWSEVAMRRVILAAAGLILIWQAAGGPMQAQAARPKLVVLLVVDQMRGDYPVRYANLLGKGLHRLTSE